MNKRNYISAKPIILIRESKAEILEKEKMRTRNFIRNLQEEAKKARLFALYEIDSSGKMYRKSIEQYKDEFRERKLNDSNFIIIEENSPQPSKQLSLPSIKSVNKNCDKQRRNCQCSFQDFSNFRSKNLGNTKLEL